MKTILITVLSLFFSGALGQTKISGTVSDLKKDPIPGANIFLLGTYDGGSSDVKGKFQFSTTETGSITLMVKFVGFKDHQQQINLTGNDLSLIIHLKEQINELNAVTITAGAFTASDESRRTVFRAIDIATTAGATADIAGALNTLPGTQKVGESGRLFVRGGDGNETRTFIDGLVVLDAYGTAAPNTPSRGRFLPFMFKGTSFSTGGYSAEYGQALSSVLALDSRDESAITRTDIGVLSVGGDVAHTKAWEGGSIAGKVQYTNLRPYTSFINQELDWKDAPLSIEGVTAFRQNVGKDSMLKFYGNFNNSDFSLYRHSIDDVNETQFFALKNRYRYFNVFYKESLTENWSVRGGASYTSIGDIINIDKTQVNELQKGLHIKTVLEGSLSEQIEIKTGVEVLHKDYDYNVATGVGNPLRTDFEEIIPAGFVEADMYANNKFVTRAGGRIEYNNLMNTLSVDPRLSLAYKTSNHSQISLAYGTFRQSAKNEFIRVNQQLKTEKAEHFILNYQLVENNRTFRVETYYKRYDHLVKFNNQNAFDLNNNGNGYAKGIELFWRDNQSVKNLDYWISYSYLDTKRDYLNFPNEAAPSFASAHNLSVVTKYFIKKLKSQVGATFSYGSGRPYFNPNSEQFNADKTPTYQDLSFNWSYLPKPYLIVHFSCTNLLGRDNIFGYEYSLQPNETGTYNGRAIRQPAPRFLFLGIFITLSKDKSMSQLPTL